MPGEAAERRVSRSNHRPMERLARLVAGASWEQIPAGVVDVAKQRLADSLGLALVGAREESGQIVTRVVKTLGGDAVATVAGAGFKTAPDNAALANGIMIHALDWDDCLGPGGMFHASAGILPAVLALGERRKASGREVLEAYILGIEVVARLTRGLNPALYRRGFHVTGVVGSFGAAAGAARLLGLGQEQTQMAFALAVHQSGAQFANKAYMAKHLSGGNSARAGVLAGLLVDAGFTGNPEILEDRFGVLDTFMAGLEGQYDVGAIVADVGERWELLTNWPIKLYPTGGGRQTLLDATLRLTREHDIQPEDVTGIEVTISPILYEEDAPRHRPKTATDTRFSHPWCAAVAIVDREAFEAQFTEERLKDPRVWSVLDRVKLLPDPKGHSATGWPTTVTITTGRGTYSLREEHQKGTPQNPTTWDDIWEKFHRCARWVLERDEDRRRLFHLIRGLEEVASVAEVTSLLAGSPGSRG